MDKNREFHELVGLCWHEPESAQTTNYGFCRHCRKPNYECEDNSDYAADPRLVLREMRTKSSDLYDDFLDSLAPELEQYGYIEAYYILDESGILRDAAIKFIRKEDNR